MRIRGFEWDDGNVIHVELGHGITPQEAEEVFAVGPVFRKTRKGHYTAFGPTAEGRFLVLVFEIKKQAIARIITGWDMTRQEKRYWVKHRKRKRH